MLPPSFTLDHACSTLKSASTRPLAHPVRRTGRLSRIEPHLPDSRSRIRCPTSLAGRLQPGHLVWIPFRGRRLQGVVLRLSDAAPDFQTREIISLVWAQPVLSSSQLTLAHWISEHTLAPLIESLRLMLPAGLSQRGRTVFVRTSVACACRSARRSSRRCWRGSCDRPATGPTSRRTSSV